MKRTIKEIKNILKTIDHEEHPLIKEWSQDQRKGVQSALLSWKKSREKQRKLQAHYEEMSYFEKEAEKSGFSVVTGIDEAGRGPLAGPVVAAAVCLSNEETIIGLNDSKKLSLKMREILFDQINEKALAVGVGIVKAEEIDRLNIYQASKIAMQQAVENMPLQPDYLLIDAMQLENNLPQKKLIKGDARSVSIAAASIIAKVTRDHIMEKYDQLYPGYGFGRHAGYGTKAHLDALKKLGATPIHRRSFSPVKTIL